jgi:H+/Cl- antiporter ClcA
MLLAIALAKMLAVSCTLHSGFRGGFIFPLFYIGAAVGLAVCSCCATNPSHNRDGLYDGSRECGDN